MKRQRQLLLFALAALGAWTGTWAQTPRYSTGFENEAETAGWVLENGTMPNWWCFGTAAHNGGSQGLYIACDSTGSNTYTSGIDGVVYAYYDFTWRGGECGVMYDWRCQGEGSLGANTTKFDFMRVFIVHPSQTFTAGVFPGNFRNSSNFAREEYLPPIWHDISDGCLLKDSTWNHVVKAVDLSQGVWRIVFAWAYDISGVFNPAAAVDNVSIGCPVCFTPEHLRFIDVTDDSCTVAWDNENHAHSWVVEWADTDFVPMTGAANMVRTTTPWCRIGGLSPATVYKVYVYAECDEGTTSQPAFDTLLTQCVALTRPDLPYRYGFENGYGRNCITNPDSSVYCMTGHPCWDLFPFYLSYVMGGYPTTESVFTSDGSRTRALKLCYRVETNHHYGAMLPYYNGDLSELMVSFSVLNTMPEPAGRLSVGYMRCATDSTTYTPVKYVTIDGEEGWQHFRVPLSLFPPRSGRIAIRYEGGERMVWLDDVELDIAPQCPHIESLWTEQVTAHSAYLRWDTRHDYAELPQSYLVSYSEAGGTVHSLTVFSPHVLLGGLNPNSRYTFTVQAVCDHGDGPAASLTFHTDCLRGRWSREPNDDTVSSRQWPCPASQMSYVSNVVTQAIFHADTLRSMGMAPGYIDACSFLWSGNIYFARPMAIYLDTTTVNTYSGAQALRFIPVDSSLLRYSGRIMSNDLGSKDYVFDEPLYWDGTTNIVLTTVIKQSSYGYGNTFFWGTSCKVDDSVSMAGSQYEPLGDTILDSASRIMMRLPYVRFRSMCDPTVVCAPPTAAVTDSTANSVTLEWAPGSGESHWRLESMAAGDTAWTVDSASTTARRCIYNSLQPTTAYRFRVTARCNDTDYSTIVTATTGCAPEPLPVTEDFEAYAPGTPLTAIPPCWQGLTDVSSMSMYYPKVYDMRWQSGSKAMLLYSTYGGYSYLVLPTVDARIDTLMLSLDLYRTDTFRGMYLQVGVIDDPRNCNSFTPVATVTTARVSDWEQFDVPLASYTGRGRYVAIASPLSSGGLFYVDNVYLDYAGRCQRPVGLRVAGTDPTTVELEWNDAGGREALVHYGTHGFTPGTGRMLTTFDSSIVITGLSSVTAYDFYVQLVCTTGDTSRTTGVMNVIPGTIISKPFVADEKRVCDAVIYDDGGPDGVYSDYQAAMHILRPTDTNHALLIQGTYRGNPGDVLTVYNGINGDDSSMLFSSEGIGGVTVGPFLSSDSTGGLTIYFTTNGSGSDSGYVLHVRCMPRRGVACGPVAATSMDSLTSSLAKVCWQDSGLFHVAIKTVDDTIWGDSVLTAASCHTFTNLTPATTYDWRVQRVCGSETFSDWRVARFVTPSPCPIPSDVNVNDITASQASVAWVAPAGTSRWEVRLTGRRHTFDTVVTSYPVQLTRLESSATYRVAVRSLCESVPSVWSDTVAFTTLSSDGIAAPSGNADGMAVTLYPNPASRHSAATLHIANADGDVLVTLLDMTGRELQKQHLSCTAGCSHRLDIQSVPQGYYFVKVQSPTSIAIRKLVVK